VKPHEKKQPIGDLILALHASFGGNISRLDEATVASLEYSSLQARAIYAIHEELQSTYCGTEPHRSQCASVMSEVFADFSIAAYLIAAGLIVPARMVCRRALESGLAAIYMWDLPHEFWEWKKFDGDLSFGSIVDHLSSRAYGAHIAALNCLSEGNSFVNATVIKKLYRKLSNTVHGKENDLPPLAPERYAPTQPTTSGELTLLVEAEHVLLLAWRTRFPGIDQYLKHDFPSLARTPSNEG
jgi:hypothetical protein